MRKFLVAATAAIALVCPRAALAQQQLQGSITTTTCTGTGGGASAQETGCIVINVPAITAGIGIQVEGTFVATLVFEVTNSSSTWVPVGGTTTTGLYPLNVSGYSRLRVRATAVTSGSATITMGASLGPLSQVPDLIAVPVTISAQCSSPTTGCSAGQWITSKLGGRNSIGGTITPAVFTGTVACYFSRDNGANWLVGFIRTTTTAEESFVTWAASVAFSGSSTFTYYTCLPTMGAVTDVALVSTAAVTNTAAVTMIASNASPHVLEAMLVPKGTQANTNMFLPVQEPKDAGRSFVAIDIDNYTLTASDALMTFAKNVAGTVTGSQTTYAITSGKTLRLQELHCTMRQTSATAASAVVRLRLNTGGACLVGSGLVQSFQIAAPTGTSAAELGNAPLLVDFPDGFELSGASWNICISAIGSSANGTLVCGFTGYEY